MSHENTCTWCTENIEYSRLSVLSYLSIFLLSLSLHSHYTHFPSPNFRVSTSSPCIIPLSLKFLIPPELLLGGIAYGGRDMIMNLPTMALQNLSAH